jgi:hypothetical protein
VILCANAALHMAERIGVCDTGTRTTRKWKDRGKVREPIGYPKARDGSFSAPPADEFSGRSLLERPENSQPVERKQNLFPSLKLSAQGIEPATHPPRSE